MPWIFGIDTDNLLQVGNQTSIVGLANTVGLIILGVLTTRNGRKVSRVRDQVENGHTTNLREENDERHDESTGLLNEVLSLVKSLGKRMDAADSRLGGISQSILDLSHRLARTEDDVHVIETTQNIPRRATNRRQTKQVDQ